MDFVSMNIWVYIAAVVIFAVGILFGKFISKYSGNYIATLIIDPVNPEMNGGVYTLWDRDPHVMVQQGKLKDHQRIVMEVLIADVARQSQQEQGT